LLDGSFAMKSIVNTIKLKLPTTAVFITVLFSNQAFSASSYMLEIVCKNHNGVVYNRQFWAKDDMDAQNKARALLSSGEFQSKGDCSIKNLKKA
jgi:hypothetical protein